MAQRVVTVLFALLGLAAGLYALWFALDDLLSGADDPWFGLMVLAVAPVLFGMGVLLPELIYAPDASARTRAVAAPFWSACQAVFMWLVAIAAGVYLAGWWPGALVGGVVGGVFAWQGLSSMRWLRGTVAPSGERRPRVTERPTRSQVVWLVVRLLLFWGAVVAMAAVAGYTIFGSNGAVAVTLITLILILVVYAVTIYRFVRRRSQPG